MKYSSIINRTLTYFSETSLWQLNLYAQELAGYRENISGLWDDSAAKEINTRYLYPHGEDKTLMLRSLERQCQFIQKLVIVLDDVEVINGNILSLSLEIQKELAYCEEDLRKAISNMDFAALHKTKADSMLPDIIQMIHSANKGEFRAI